MKRVSIFFLAAFLLTACGSNQRKTENQSAADSASIPSDSMNVSDKTVADAYIYLFGRYLVIQQENYDINVEKAGYNKIKYNPLGSAQFVNPNMDVAYLEAWIATDSDHAVILNIPKIENRYYTAQLLDGWGEVIANINERNFPKTPYGKFALFIKGTHPPIPADAVSIPMPAAKAKLLARVELKGTPAIAQKLQVQFTLTVPAGIKIDPPLSIAEFTHAKPIGGAIFENVEGVLASYPDIMPKAADMQAEAIKVAAYRTSGEAAKQRVDSIVETQAIPAFLAGARGFGTQKGGWSVSYVAGNFGDDMMARDIINYGGLWANSINEAIYFIGQTDNDKQLLSGDHAYEIRFAKDSLPGAMVDAFWSITLYSVPDYRVVANPLNRYNLNNVSGLKKSADGSISIWLASVMPKGIPSSNWLPTPAGKGFALNFRMYVPKKAVQDGSWFPSPIQRTDK